MSATGIGARLSSQTTAVSGGSNLTTTQSWFYNGLGLPAHHYHARAFGQTPFVVSYGYDAGLPVKEYTNGIPVVTSVGYQPSGALAGYSTGINVGHNVTTTIVQDASLLPRPSSIATSGASVNFVSGSYSYDGTGNIMAIGADGYGYDLRSRLTSASLSGSGNQNYTYDQFGNLLTKTGTPGNTTFCSPSCTNNRLPSSVAAYDGRGNVTTNWIAPGGAEYYTPDGLDRLITHQGPTFTWDYLYDGDSERIAKVLRSGGWTYTFRDEGKRVSSEFGASNPSRDNVFLGNLLAVSYASVPGSDRVWTFYSSDHLGTPRLITDITAVMIETPKNWPFGENVTTPGPFQRIRFASMERDTEASRYHDHARGHEFNLGRFLSPDKAGGKGDDPQTWNRYAYARDNPSKFVDADGKEFGYPGQQADLNRVLFSQLPSGSEICSQCNAGRGLGRDIPLHDPVAELAGSLVPTSPAEVGMMVALGGLERVVGGAMKFASGKLLAEHFEKHAAEFGLKAAGEYLQGAEKLAQGGEGVATAVRANGDRLFYKESSNEFLVVKKDGTTIRTYMKPKEGAQYWQNELKKMKVDN